MRNAVSEGRGARRWRDSTSYHGTLIMTHARTDGPPHIGTTTGEPAWASASPESVTWRQPDALAHQRVSGVANECGNVQPSQGFARMATVEHDRVENGLDRHSEAAKMPK
jgi:hypothetical protein